MKTKLGEMVDVEIIRLQILKLVSLRLETDGLQAPCTRMLQQFRPAF
jgi:hypothetical protein